MDRKRCLSDLLRSEERSEDLVEHMFKALQQSSVGDIDEHEADFARYVV